MACIGGIVPFAAATSRRLLSQSRTQEADHQQTARYRHTEEDMASENWRTALLQSAAIFRSIDAHAVGQICTCDAPLALF